MIVQPRELYTTDDFEPTTPTYTWEPQPRLASDDIVPPAFRYPDALDQGFVFQPSEQTQDRSTTDPIFNAYREAMDSFYATHEQPSIRIDQLTGLPALIYGILQKVEDGQSTETAAEQFLKENQLVVSGVPDDGTNKAGSEVVLEPRLRSRWQDGSEHLLYAQLNPNNVPIFGSHVALTYQAQVLTLITAALLPMPAEALDQLEWDEGWAEVWWHDWYALKTFPQEIEWAQFLPPPELNPAAQHGTLEIDRCIFPYIPYYTHENNTNLKLIFATDAEGDAHVEDGYWYLPGADFFDALGDRPLIRSAGGGIYRPAWRVVAADKAGNHWLTLIDAETAQILWFYALDFHASVQIIPQSAVQFAAVGAQLEAGIIAAQEEFAQWLGLSTHSTTAAFYPIEHVQVNLDPNETTRYRWQEHTIYIGGAMGGQWPLGEPGADPEVVFHEFTHAMTHFLRTQIIEVKTEAEAGQTQGLNEGFGFFLACTHANDHNYGETAYAAWINQPSGEPWLDLEEPPFQRQDCFQLANSPPFAGTHKRGLWWAKVWWALGLDAQIGLTLARELVLQALQLAQPLAHTSLFADVMLTVAQNRSDIPDDVVLALLQSRDAYLVG